MQNIRHFIWDFDGTLFDTYPMIIGSLRLALQDFGFDCDPVEAMQYMLDTIGAARDHYADVFGIDRDVLTEAYRRYNSEAVAALRAEPFVGLQEVLERIQATGGKNYIFTHRSSQETEMFLKKFDLSDYFEEIIGPDCPHFSWKPAPDAVLYLMEKYGMSPAETVMVGDRECDLGSGRSAGIGAVHYVCAEVPETLECSWRVTDYKEMLALL